MTVRALAVLPVAIMTLQRARCPMPFPMARRDVLARARCRCGRVLRDDATSMRGMVPDVDAGRDECNVTLGDGRSMLLDVDDCE